MSAGVLGSNGKNFKDKLPKQRELTDLRIKEIKTLVNSLDLQSIDKKVSEVINGAIEDITKIASFRLKISSLDIKTANAIAYYTNMNSKFLNTIVKISNFSSSPEITKQIIAYLNFLMAKE